MSWGIKTDRTTGELRNWVMLFIPKYENCGNFEEKQQQKLVKINT